MAHTKKGAGVVGYFDAFGEPNEFDFLSNFYEGEPLLVHADSQDPKVGWRDYSFATGEHMFAALKARHWKDFDEIRLAKTPGKAKSIGRRIELREDWEQNKYDAMMWTLRTKFTIDRYEGMALLATGDQLLIEGTHWNDTVWGVALGKNGHDDALRSPGRNWLGTLLMARRAELRAEHQYEVTHPTGHFNQLFCW